MITFKRFTLESAGQPAFTIFCEGKEDAEAFKELVQRGSNLWPDAPAAIKELADLVTNGEILQPYREMTTSNKSVHRS